MEQITSRPYSPASDQPRVEVLLLATRAGRNLERYPTIWRLRQLLATRLWEPEDDARVWETVSGQLVGCIILSRRRREDLSSSFDLLIHPQAPYEQLYAEMLDWAEARIQARATLHNEKIFYGVATYENEPVEIQLLERKGYILSPHGYDFYMGYPLDHALPTPTLPPGFTLRPLDGATELDAYMELFRFASMTREHRRELLSHPDEYTHLVVVAPDGALVAYCECSINRQEWRQSGRRIGWIDYIATRDEFRRRGLAEALMWAALQHLQAWGTERAMLVMTSANTSAYNFYCKLGFQVIERNIYYDKTLES